MSLTLSVTISHSLLPPLLDLCSSPPLHVHYALTRLRPISSRNVYSLQPFKSFGKNFDVVPADHAFGAEIGKRSTELIEKYKVRGNPVDIRGGLEAVAEGLEHQKVCFSTPRVLSPRLTSGRKGIR